MRPRDCKTLDDICSLQRDNLSVGDFWMLTGEAEITLCQQKDGERPKGAVTLPKATFDRFVDCTKGGTRPVRL